MFLVFHEQITNGQDPQAINQSKQHKQNQKWRPKSANKQLISQKRNRSLLKIKTQIHKSTQGRSASVLWLGFEEKKVIKGRGRKFSLLGLLTGFWVLKRNNWKVITEKWKTLRKKSSVFLKQFRSVIFLLFLTQNSQYCTFVGIK